MPDQTDNHGWTVPVPNQDDDWGVILNALIEDHLDVEVIQYGTPGERPDAGGDSPILFFDTNSEVLQYNDGTDWTTIGDETYGDDEPITLGDDDDYEIIYDSGGDRFDLRGPPGIIFSVFSGGMVVMERNLKFNDGDEVRFGSGTDIRMGYKSDNDRFEINHDGNILSMDSVGDFRIENGALLIYSDAADGVANISLADSSDVQQIELEYDESLDRTFLNIDDPDGSNQPYVNINHASTSGPHFPKGLSAPSSPGILMGDELVATQPWANPSMSIADSTTAILSDPVTLNFGSNLNVTDDGGDEVTVDATDSGSFSGSHNDLTDVSTGDHHTKTQPSDIDSSNWNDYEIQVDGTDGAGIINFKTT